MWEQGKPHRETTCRYLSKRSHYILQTRHGGKQATSATRIVTNIPKLNVIQQQSIMITNFMGHECRHAPAELDWSALKARCLLVWRLTLAIGREPRFIWDNLGSLVLCWLGSREEIPKGEQEKGKGRVILSFLRWLQKLHIVTSTILYSFDRSGHNVLTSFMGMANRSFLAGEWKGSGRPCGKSLAGSFQMIPVSASDIMEQREVIPDGHLVRLSKWMLLLFL